MKTDTSRTVLLGPNGEGQEKFIIIDSTNDFPPRILYGETEDTYEIYFFGIIDCLTYYGWKKKVAHCCKRILWKKETLSTIPPECYRKRFSSFIKTWISK